MRLVAVLLWTIPAACLQAVLLLLPGGGKAWFARVYWRGVARIIGMRRRVIGPCSPHRPTLFIANHCSWLDIVALGATLPGCFVAKAEIGQWPGVSIVAKLGRTIFVSRSRETVAREQRLLAARLGGGDNVILFPEGTTSDGNRVLPFSSAFFTLAFGEAQPWVQSVTVVYDELEGQPVRRFDRPLVAWYGDMDLAPHLKPLLHRRGVRATIMFGEPLPPGSFANRKALSLMMEQTISANAARLRQGRDAPQT
ncbi:lysophospholipid acyltransferase family protein [Acidocella aminolytica]|uniref:1-acyl-sn-glycerol-3-phosphate acyltransferase n=1 Tax=Acidocella aminolytica 101 = DSM 11237 TaxID=1120923 RepID=A0A0D6PIM1_9PROT|nr:lysophospholipid acyltransferase family protein [Acidocella aminolytica]GAN81221.1 1-acyl-sn-glycerol-3-phosphate acyltransferase [Acidocella aminolytica 101 = DSM 11237]GBQ31914.1 1-acyl-sn-glycerol-3-phosphate acyltransferase [Acidocella aminolytica 101 = DSM 11237]SHE85054.1 lyso-ornithine lipid acyltransferase [Acidocella aminolytica 101 = DSM 11237]